EQLGRQHRFAVLFVLGDDLQHHAAGEVLAGARIAHLEVLAFDDELAHVLDGDVTGNLGVVQTPVRILLDDAHCHAQPPWVRPEHRAARARLQLPRYRTGPAGIASGVNAGTASRNSAATEPAPAIARSSWPSARQAARNAGSGSSGSTGRDASDFDNLRPSSSSTSGRCAWRGTGRPSACRSRIWRGVESSRSAPRTTSVIPCAASSTTTASWYAHGPSARRRTKSPTAVATSCSKWPWIASSKPTTLPGGTRKRIAGSGRGALATHARWTPPAAASAERLQWQAKARPEASSRSSAAWYASPRVCCHRTSPSCSRPKAASARSCARAAPGTSRGGSRSSTRSTHSPPA